MSLQYHQQKDETIMVMSGRIRFTSYYEGEEPLHEELGPLAPVHVVPGMRHRMEALEDTDIVEVSTPELDDVVRLEDRYGRAKTP